MTDDQLGDTPDPQTHPDGEDGAGEEGPEGGPRELAPVADPVPWVVVR